jgi:hypothetical protein
VLVHGPERLPEEAGPGQLLDGRHLGGHRPVGPHPVATGIVRHQGGVGEGNRGVHPLGQGLGVAVALVGRLHGQLLDRSEAGTSSVRLLPMLVGVEVHLLSGDGSHPVTAASVVTNAAGAETAAALATLHLRLGKGLAVQHRLGRGHLRRGEGLAASLILGQGLLDGMRTRWM